VSFVTDIIDLGVCPGFWINKKNGKLHSPSLHKSTTQHCRKTH